MKTLCRCWGLLAVVAVLPVHADSFRCGSDLITKGESAIRLKVKCGEPVARETLTRKEMDKRGVTHVIEYGERWTYNFGSSNFMQLVTVENGLVTEIENGPRGF